MLNLKHLYYFHVFAQELNIKKTAKRLGITSPALSNQLKHLENFLGSPLAVRANGRFSMTPSGELILIYTQRMFAAYDDLRFRLAHAAGTSQSQFRVGICQSLGAQFSFDLLSLIVKVQLSEAHHIRVDFDSSQNLLVAFKKNELDLIVGAFSDESINTNWLTQKLTFPVRLFSSPLPMSGLTDHERKTGLVGVDRIIELAHSRQISIVLPEKGSVLRQETDRFLYTAKVRPTRTIECNNCCAIVQLIERGFAMGFVPIPSLLDFKSARSLAVLGPALGYWGHDISVFIQKGEGRSLAKISPLEEMFSPFRDFN